MTWPLLVFFYNQAAYSQGVPCVPTFSLHLLVPQTLVVKFLTLGHLSRWSPMPKTYLAFKGLAAMLCFF